jgi:hypothetical protein
VFGVGRPDKQPEGDGKHGDGQHGDGQQSQDTPGEAAESAGKRVGPSKKAIVIGVAVAAVVAAAGGFALSNHGNSHNSAAPASAMPQSTGPLKLESITPASGTSQVDGAAPITVSFNAPVAANSPDPTLQPPVPGSWSAIGDDLIFTPDSALRPSTQETLDVPSGPAGVRGADGGLLTSGASDRFSTGSYSSLRLAEILGQLGYLPMTWTQGVSGSNRQEMATVDGMDGSQESDAYDPPAGTFTWESGYPTSMQSLWTSNGQNEIVRGAVYAFQAQHGMTVDGDVTPGLWEALFKAVQAGDVNKVGYTYAIASQDVPETLTIWHNGQVVLHSLANTGIPASPTVNGTFPVYEKYYFQIMQGTNPDGSAYADPVYYVSYFNGGDAVHYFPRGSYGFQQSLGCVELPWDSARQAYPYLTYGSLVTVTG